jgi:hypothetical protein
MTAKSSFGRKTKRQAARAVGPPSRSIRCTPLPVRVVFSHHHASTLILSPSQLSRLGSPRSGTNPRLRFVRRQSLRSHFQKCLYHLPRVILECPLMVLPRRWLLGRIGLHRPWNRHKCRLLVALCPPWVVNNPSRTTTFRTQRVRIAERCSQTVRKCRVRQFDQDMGV